MSKRSALPRPSSSRSRASSRASAVQEEERPVPSQSEQTFDTSTLPPSLLRLHQKQQEYASLQALHEASAALVAKVEIIAEMGNVMADGGEGESRWMIRTSECDGADDSYWAGVPELEVRLCYLVTIRWVLKG